MFRAAPPPRRTHHRLVQLLTANALMLALDGEQDASEGAADLARVSAGDLEALDAAAERVRELARSHPGSDAERAVAIVEGARARVASLHRHPSLEPDRRFHLV